MSLVKLVEKLEQIKAVNKSMSSTIANQDRAAYQYQKRIHNLSKELRNHQNLNVHVDAELRRSRSELGSASHQLSVVLPQRERYIQEQDSAFEDRVRTNNLYVDEKKKNTLLLAYIDKLKAEKEDAVFSCHLTQNRAERNTQLVAGVRKEYYEKEQRVAKILGPTENKTFEECIDQWEKAMTSVRRPPESLAW